MNIKDAFLGLVRQEVFGQTISPEIFDGATEEQLLSLYRFAKMHDLGHLLYGGLLKLNLLDDKGNLKKALYSEHALAVFRTEQITFELQSITTALSGAKISHIPLKGAVLRGYYPEGWMRTSCDIDVLVRKEDLELAVEVLRAQLDYTVDADHYHDISLYAPSGVHLELHYELIENIDSKKIHSMQKSVWDWLKPSTDGVYTREMIDEYFYFYHLAHMAKHFVYGGCGIRAFIDTHILNEKISYDKSDLEKILKDGNLLRFYDSAKKICLHWFNSEPLPNELTVAEDYVLRGGVYGNKTNNFTVKQVQHGKKRYLLQNVFPKLKYLRNTYPVLIKHPYLYPFCLIAKWCKVIFRKGGPTKNLKSAMELNSSITEQQREQTKKMLIDIGLEKMMK